LFWFGCLLCSSCVMTPNENKISRRWRERA
jgi:hypothetical protein